MSAFSSIDLYYELDARRERSREIHFGSLWFHDEEGYPFRLTWVEQTGELILARARGEALPRRISVATHETGIRALLRQPELNVFVVATLPDRGQVDELLDGWAEQCGNPDSLDWLITRIVTAGVR